MAPGDCCTHMGSGTRRRLAGCSSSSGRLFLVFAMNGGFARIAVALGTAGHRLLGPDETGFDADDNMCMGAEDCCKGRRAGGTAGSVLVGLIGSGASNILEKKSWSLAATGITAGKGAGAASWTSSDRKMLLTLFLIVSKDREKNPWFAGCTSITRWTGAARP